MADFPRAIPIHMSSRDVLLDEVMVSRSRAGRARGRRMWPNSQREFRVVLQGLTDAQRESVQLFLITNRKLAFNFRWPYGGATFQVIWIDSQIEWQDLGGRLSSAQVTFTTV